jgi:hypothetical protein
VFPPRPCRWRPSSRSIASSYTPSEGAALTVDVMCRPNWEWTGLGSTQLFLFYFFIFFSNLNKNLNIFWNSKLFQIWRNSKYEQVHNLFKIRNFFKFKQILILNKNSKKLNKKFKIWTNIQNLNTNSNVNKTKSEQEFKIWKKNPNLNKSSKSEQNFEI